MRGRWIWVVMGALILGGPAEAEEVRSLTNWKRIDSRYSTIWLHPEVDLKRVNKKISTWRVRPRVKAKKGAWEGEELAAKVDTIFRKAQEILDMYPAGIHTTIRVVKEKEEIENIHADRYGYGTKAAAFYVFENNTIYATEKDISEHVLAHEMGHCIIDHYFGIRPPRKIEEMLAMHVDANLRE